MSNFLTHLSYSFLLISYSLYSMSPKDVVPKTLADLPAYYAHIVERLTEQPVTHHWHRDKKELELSYEDTQIVYELESFSRTMRTRFFPHSESTRCVDTWKLATNMLDYKADIKELTESYTQVVKFLQQDWHKVKVYDFVRDRDVCHFSRKIYYSDTFGKYGYLLMIKQLLSRIAIKFNTPLLHCDYHCRSDHAFILMVIDADKIDKFKQTFNFHDKK